MTPFFQRPRACALGLLLFFAALEFALRSSVLLGTIALGYALIRMFPLFVQLVQGRGLPEEGVVHEMSLAGQLLAFLSWIVFFMPERPREYWAM